MSFLFLQQRGQEFSICLMIILPAHPLSEVMNGL